MITADTLRQRLGRVYGRIDDTQIRAILGAMANMLETGHTDCGHGIDQLHLARAANEWLDLWGNDYYAIPRRNPEEPDITYAWRIIVETIRQRPQRHALQLIVQQTRRTIIQIRDLWPTVMISDQFSPNPDGHLHHSDTHYLYDAGEVDSLETVSLGYPFLPTHFGVWIMTKATEAFLTHIPTEEEVIDHVTLILISDQFDADTIHLLDGDQINISTSPVGAILEDTPASPPLTDPDHTADVSAPIRDATIPASTDEVLEVIHRHRAAGTRPVMMGVIPDPLPEIIRVDDAGALIIASGFGAHENLILESPDTARWLVMIAAETGQLATTHDVLGQAVIPKTLTSPNETLYNMQIDNAGAVTTVAV